MGASQATPLRIGEWQADPANGEIARGGETVRLDPRTMRLLLHLASRPGEVVSIDELLDQVWPGVTVTQDSVYQAIASLRRQLGDDPKQPRYIATVPRLGYRMVADVAPATSATPAPARQTLARWIMPAAAAVLIAVSAGWGVWYFTVPSPQVAVGVLPVRDETDAMNQEVLVDNLTEDLADGLSRSGFRTPGARSSFALRGKHLSPPAEAKELGVDYILDANVRQSGPNLLITARLIRADTGFVMWSKTYHEAPSKLAAIRHQIIGEIARRT